VLLFRAGMGLSHISTQAINAQSNDPGKITSVTGLEVKDYD